MQTMHQIADVPAEVNFAWCLLSTVPQEAVKRQIFVSNMYISEKSETEDMTPRTEVLDQ